MKRFGRTNRYIAGVLLASLTLSTLLPAPVLAATTTISTSDGVTTDNSGSDTQEHRWAPESMRKYGITYADFCKKYGEPASAHILVGTYLINMVPTEQMIKDSEDAVSGATYIGALKSKLTYSQDVKFYKSELAGGEWRDVEFADNMSSIRVGSGTPVSDEEMDEMLITKYISGGEEIDTKDADSSSDEDASRKNPFLEPSPYNLDEMPEMEGLLNMLSDGTLSYDVNNTDYTKVAETQSNYFLADRLRYMFAHDEVTGTIKLRDGDFERAKSLDDQLTAGAGSSINVRIEKQFDETEEKGDIFLDPLSDIPSTLEQGGYSLGEGGTIASASRLLYHFSDTRDELTDVMDEAVVNLWEVYLNYRDEAKAAGEEEDSFEPQEGVLYNKDKYSFLYEVCSQADSTRRGEAYYNLSANSDFHGGTGSVLSNMIQMNENGTSSIGRNIQNADYYEEARRPSLPERVGAAITGLTETLSGLTANLTGGGAVSSDASPLIPVSLGGFKSNEALGTELKTAQTAAQNKFTDYSAYTLSRGSTALSQLIYDDETALFKKTKKDDATDQLIEEGIYACAIRDDNIKSAANEAKLLTEKLIRTQNRMLGEYISAELPDGYDAIDATAKDADNQKKALLLSQQSTAKNSEYAMEKLIDAYLSRDTDKESNTTVLTAQLTWIRAQKKNIADTDYATYAEEVRDTYEQYIINKMRSLDIEVPDDDSEGDPIDWEGAKKKALDDNDPRGLDQIEKLQDKYQSEPHDTPPGYTPVLEKDPVTGNYHIDYQEKETPTTDNDLGDPGSNGMGNSGSAGKNINGGSGRSGSSDGRGGNSGVGSGSGSGANGTGSGDAGTSGAGGDGNGDGTSGLPIPNGSMLDNLEDFLGQKFDDMDPDSQAELVAALNQFGRENNNEEALELARDLLERIMNNKNPFVFAQYTRVPDTEYVSLACIDRARLYTRLRLVREGTDITISSINSGLSYVYSYGSPTMRKIDGSTEAMTAALVSQKDSYMGRSAEDRFPYLAEEDTQNKLGCRAEYIIDTYYAILVTTAMEPNIKKIVKQLEDWYKY